MAFVSRPQQGYFIELVPEFPSQSEHFHFFCGPQTISGAWCRNCGKPLLHLLTIEATDPRLDLADTRKMTLPLLYCWRCGVPKGDFLYRLVDENHINIETWERGPEVPGFPYEDYPTFFPGSPCVLRAVTTEEQRLLDALSGGVIQESDVPKHDPDLASQPHQVGGRPYLLQPDAGDALVCSGCRREMSFLASIGDRCLDSRGLVGYLHAQLLFHICHHCCIIGARNRAD